MQSTNGFVPQSGSKLLPFRTPSAALQGPDATLGPDQIPHDIASLSRPNTYIEQPMREEDGLAHDARNLMTSLEFFSTLLAEPGVLGEGHEHFAGDLRLLNGVLGTLVERLASAPAASGKPLFVREPVRPRTAPRVAPEEWSDAGVMVKSCERLLAAVAGPGVMLQVSAEPGVGPLALGGEELTRVLINLVKNASEATPTGGRVAVSLRKGVGPGTTALLTVQDNGAGIPAHALGQIFQAGFTSKKSQRKWPALSHHGLGLTIVRELVEGAGGSVRVSSASGKGTTFEIRLPRR